MTRAKFWRLLYRMTDKPLRAIQRARDTAWVRWMGAQAREKEEK